MREPIVTAVVFLSVTAAQAQTGPAGGLVWDSGEPSEVGGYLPYFDSFWQLDIWENRNNVVMAPVMLDRPALVDRIAIFGRTTTEQLLMHIEVFGGTGLESQGTKLTEFNVIVPEPFEGWVDVYFPEAVVLPAGGAGVVVTGEFEFQTLWASNAERGTGYIWTSMDEEVSWRRLAAENGFGFDPDMTLRVYAVLADIDRDANVDLADFLILQRCFGGAGRAVSGECVAADLDADGDVDLSDFVVFQSSFGGSQSAAAASPSAPLPAGDVSLNPTGYRVENEIFCLEFVGHKPPPSERHPGRIMAPFKQGD